MSMYPRDAWPTLAWFAFMWVAVAALLAGRLGARLKSWNAERVRRRNVVRSRERVVTWMVMFPEFPPVGSVPRLDALERARLERLYDKDGLTLDDCRAVVWENWQATQLGEELPFVW